MAILNFPDTTGQPTDGSFTYTENDITYVWDGVKWTAQGGTGGGGGLWEQNGNDIFYNNGNVGIGTNAPGSPLAVSTATAGAALDVTSTQAGNNGGLRVSVGVEDREARLQATFGNSSMTFYTEGATGGPRERARIDNAGRVLVGLNNDNFAGTVSLQGRSDDAAGGPIVRFKRGEALPTNGLSLGNIFFSDGQDRVGAEIQSITEGNWNAGSVPARLGFFTTPNGSTVPAERMRITSEGNLLNFCANGNGVVSGNSSAAGTTNDLFLGIHSRTSVTGGGTTSFRVTTNGDVTNTTGNAITPIGSERRIKDKIGSFDPTEAWNVVKNATPRPYELKEMPGTQCYGYIVDELPEDLVLPGTTEDEEGPIRTYDSNRLAFMYRVALKEALGRIEQLEAIVVELSKKVA